MRSLGRVVIGVFCGLAVLRLIGFVLVFGAHSLQMDFAAFYTAGQAVKAGLSPYVNHVLQHPEIWDGVASYTHSRFLYPPPTALFFVPVSLLPYFLAKYVWMFFALGLIVWSLKKHAELLKVDWKESYPLILLISALFFPLLVFLERGQIDALTLALITASLPGLLDQSALAQKKTGFFLALATIFKLHVIFIIPFLLLRQKWTILKFFILSGLLITAFSAAVLGPSVVVNYLKNDLPRISQYGEGGPKDQRLPSEIISAQKSGLESNQSRVQGKIYNLAVFDFAPNATVVAYGVALSDKIGANWSRSIMSISLLLLSVGLMSTLFFLKPNTSVVWTDKVQEYFYWQAVLAVILLTAPLTWTMNIIWSLPIIVLLIFLGKQWPQNPVTVNMVLLCLGFFLLAIPDSVVFPLVSPLDHLIGAKYVVGEALILLALLDLRFGYFRFIKSLYKPK